MQLTAFAPRADASRLIEGLAVMRTEGGITRTLVAESRLSIGMRIAGAAHLWHDGGWQPLPRHTLTGVHCHSRTVRTEPRGTLVLAHLHPAAASALGLARALGLSVDTLERRFTAGVGTSPKRFARAVRLRSAVLAYSAGVTLTEVAMQAGYYDQSHFVREMRQATGQAPQRLLVAQAYC